MHDDLERRRETDEAGCEGGLGMFYFVGFIGAAVYYIQASDSFWGGVGGFFKAMVWPAFFVYELLRSAGA